MRRQPASFRNRLTVSPLIAAPGTFELDVLNGFTANGSYWMPTTLRFTPESDNAYLKHTEWGINADVVDSFVTDGNRLTQLSDHITFTSTTAVKWNGINVGIAPMITVQTRGEGGFRGGGSALLRVDPGLNSIGGSVSWTGASQASDTNPAGIFDVAFGYGRKLGQQGLLQKLTLHANITVEKQTSLNRFFTMLEGMEYQLSDGFSLDLSAQHVGISTGTVDHQILLGVNWTIRAAR